MKAANGDKSLMIREAYEVGRCYVTSDITPYLCLMNYWVDVDEDLHEC